MSEMHEPGPDEENREGDPQDMEAEPDGADEKSSLGDEVLEPRGMEATPTMASPPPETDKDAREGSEEVGLTVSATERCGTLTDLLSLDSPSWLRTSPKRKQLSPPEGSEVAADRENAVKRHRGSTPEQTPFSRLPSRMPYWSPPLTDKTGLGATGEEGDESMEPREEEEPTDSSTAPEDESEPSETPSGDELKEPTLTAPSDGDGISGPLRDGPTPVGGALDPPERRNP